MKIKTLSCLLCCASISLALATDPANSETPESNKPISLTFGDGYFLNQITEINFNTGKEAGSLLLYGNTKTNVQLIVSRNPRNFDFSTSKHGQYLLLVNNYAAAENYAIMFERQDYPPYLSPIFQTPAAKNERATWKLAAWDDYNSQVFLTKTSSEGKSESFSFPFESKSDQQTVTSVNFSGRIYSPNKKSYYQMVPELGDNGLPSGKKTLVVSRADHSWAVAVNNIPLSITIKWSSKGDSFSIFDNEYPQNEHTYEKTKEHPFVKHTMTIIPVATS